MIYDDLMNDIKQAMFDKNAVKRDCLRSIVSEIKNQTVNAGKDMSDSVCLSVIKKAVKQHNDSIENFKAGKREDLAMKEMEELDYISCYLPKMYSEMTIQTIILKIIADNNIPEVKKSLGQIMKLLNALPDKDLIDKRLATQYLNALLK